MSCVMMRIITDLTVVPPVLLVVLHPGVGSWMVAVMSVITDTTVISVTNNVAMDVKIKHAKASGHCECKDEFYGDQCDKECSPGCNTRTCKKSDGYCSSCHDRFYGHQCNLRCSSNCVSCTKAGGACLECKDGFYGGQCEKLCSSGCRNTYCNKADGYCDCKDGFYGSQCDKQCTVNCKSCHKLDSNCLVCEEGYYDDECDKQCSSGCTSICGKSDGVCDSCKDGSYGDFCNRTCSFNCKDEICHRDGSCTCKPGYSGTQCQDGMFKL